MKIKFKFSLLMSHRQLPLIFKHLFTLPAMFLSLVGALYFPEFQKQVRRGAVLKYEVR